ncbi:Cytochrome P450 [Amanita muscaria]
MYTASLNPNMSRYFSGLITMDDTTKLCTVFLGAATLLIAPSIWKTWVNSYKLRAIPTVGTSGHIGALQFFSRAPALLREGCKKYRGSIFKVSTWPNWLILVSGPQMIDELRNASDDELSAEMAFRESLQMEYTLDAELFKSHYHLDVVRSSLTRSIANKLSEVQDEIETAFNDHLKAETDEWATVTAYPTIMDIVCRTSNRLFVGLPLCRDPDYLDLNKKFSISLVLTASILTLLPSFLKPIVLPLFRELPRGIKRGYKHLEPLFKDRLEKEARYGKDWPGEPSFTYVLFELATRPEYVQPMRDEIEEVIRQEGWSKISVGKMKKVDSFIKETLRLADFPTIVMQRKAMKDFTFSNGVTVPAGNTVAVATTPTHTDSEFYTDPETFDGFRFEKMRDEEGMGHKHQFISLDVNYVLFGGGRRACPGRFFAAHELKVMLAHVLMNYDVQMANGGGRPEKLVLGTVSLPDRKAQVMFRKRA